MSDCYGDFSLPGERVIHRARIHPAVYLPSGVFACGALLAWPFLPPAAAALAAFAGMAAFSAWTARNFTEIVLTDRRVVSRFGWVAREARENRLGSMEAVSVSQGVLGRLMGYGSVTVSGVGGTPVPVPFVAEPWVFRRKLDEALHGVTAEEAS